MEELPCSSEDYEELVTIISEARSFVESFELNAYSDIFHPPHLSYTGTGLVIYHFDDVPEPAQWLPDKFYERFYKKLASLMEQADINYIQFGVAFTSDSYMPSSFSGTEFRLFKDGTSEYAELKFKRDK